MVVKVRMNSAGVIALLKSPAVQADLAARAQRIEAALPNDGGAEWQVNTFTGKDRAQAVVKTSNTAAREAVANSPAVMISALGAGR